jgi:nitrite reductase/ring-hydroxylating ferredoxin subunit
MIKVSIGRRSILISNIDENYYVINESCINSSPSLYEGKLKAEKNI